MATRKSAKSRSKAKKPATKRGTNAKVPAGLSAGVPREIVAIILAAITILLIFGVFGFGGVLITSLFHGLRLIFGYAAYVLPVVTGLLAYMLFRSDEYDVTATTYIGLVGFVISLAALLHVGITPDTAKATARAGLGGGYVGYGISKLMLTVLDPLAAAVILIALLAIFLILAANVRLGDLFSSIASLFHREKAEGDLQINEPGVAASTALPIKGTLGRAKEEKEPETALVAINDPNWTLPSLELLKGGITKPDSGNIKQNAVTIQTTLSSFGIDVAMGEVNVGPTVTQYTLKPSGGVKLSKITELSHNLALALAAPSIRVEAPIPGKGAVGVEVPNKAAATVRLRDALADPLVADNKSPLEFVLGRDVAGRVVDADLTKMPHLLIAGATGSGKSVMINVLLTSLLYRNSPSNLKLILVDPKRVELSLYNGIPHLLSPVIVDPEKCISALKWAVAEMERRYKLLAEVGKRNINEYNAAGREEAMPYIVIVIDELADLMAVSAADVESLVVRLAQMARAVGIHLVLATQRPSVNVITGLIKANIPSRIAFTVASQVDSRTILDQAGAEKLMGKGDMLFASPEFIKPRRIQAPLTDEGDTKAVTDFLRDEQQPQYNEEILTQPVKVGGRGGGEMGDIDDDLFEEAAEAVFRAGKASTSMLQRRLRVGYARAARLIDLLEERGVVGPADGARPRDVLVSSLDAVDLTPESEVSPPPPAPEPASPPEVHHTEEGDEITFED